MYRLTLATKILKNLNHYMQVLNRTLLIKNNESVEKSVKKNSIISTGCAVQILHYLVTFIEYFLSIAVMLFLQVVVRNLL